MANEQEREQQADALESAGASSPTSAEPPSPDVGASLPAEGELDLSPVIKKKDEETVPFEVLEVADHPGSRIDVKVQIPESEYEKRLETLLKDLRKTVTVDGFRRGHAPLRILRNLYGKDAKPETVEKMMEPVVKALSEEKGWKLAGEAEVKDFEVESGKPVVATFTFEVYPKVEVATESIASVSVDVEARPFDEAEVEAELEKMRQEAATYVAKPDDGAFDPETDGVALDMFVTDDKGGNVPDKSLFDEFLPKPAEGLPAEVVEALTGKKVGEEVEVRTENGFGYHATVRGIKTRQVPVLDDEFAKDLGEKFPTLEALRGDIRRKLEEEEEQRRRREAVGGILSSLLEKVPFEVPQQLVLATAADRIGREEEQFRRFGLNLNQVLGDRVTEYVQSATESAETTVKIGILVRAIAEGQGVEASDEDLQKEFERLAEKSGRSPMAIRAHYEARKKVDELKEDIVQRRVEDHLFELATVNHKTPEEMKAIREAEEAKAKAAAEEAPSVEEETPTASGEAPKADEAPKAEDPPPAAEDKKPKAKAATKSKKDAEGDAAAETKPKAAKPKAKKAKPEADAPPAAE